DDVRVASGRHKCREPIQSGNDAVVDLAGGNATWPADYAGHAEAALQCGSLCPGERGLTAIRPRKALRALVPREAADGVVVEALVAELFHDGAHYVVELRKSRLGNRPPILRITHVLVFLGEVSDDMHARWVKPDEERLVLPLRTIDKVEREL